MNKELIQNELEAHEKRLNNHGSRLDKFEQDSRELKVELKNLCENLKALTNTMKCFIAALEEALISFFFYCKV